MDLASVMALSISNLLQIVNLFRAGFFCFSYFERR